MLRGFASRDIRHNPPLIDISYFERQILASGMKIGPSSIEKLHNMN